MTRFTEGAWDLMEWSKAVVPWIAGSRKSALEVMLAKKKGEAWWITAVRGGVDWTAESKALGAVMSGTMAKSIWEVYVEKSCWIWDTLAWERTTLRTLKPDFRSSERMWEPRKPLAPVRRTFCAIVLINGLIEIGICV